MNVFLVIIALIALLAGYRLLVRYVRHDGFAPSPTASTPWSRLDTTLHPR